MSSAIKPEDVNEQLWREIGRTVNGDDTAARALLAAGEPIYYCEDDTPDDLLIKEYPDGRRELIRFSWQTGDEVVRTL